MKSAVIVFIVVAMSGIVYSKVLEQVDDIVSTDMMEPEAGIHALDLEDDISNANMSNEVGNANKVCRTLGYYEFCYFAKPTMQFGQAQEFCMAQNGNLASINSKEEQTLVHALIKTTDLYTTTWIGYIDTEATGINWNWIDGKGGYTNWNISKPSGKGQYLCAIIFNINGEWYNRYCKNTFSVLCRMYKP